VRKTLNKATLNKMQEKFPHHQTKMDGALVQQKKTELIKELFRKAIHMLTVFIPFLLRIAYYPVILLLTLVLIVYVLSEILRLHKKEFPIISHITSAAARQRDGHGFVLGPVMLALGVILTALIFDPVSAQIGITALALGDGLASLVGKLCGKICIPFTKGKTLMGSLSCFIAIFLSTLCITRSLAPSLIIAFSGTLIELIPIKDVDNILIPLSLALLAHFII
jgi:phytol kinase